jgi:hypothetical protein
MSAETQTDQLQHFADFARDFAAKAQALAAGEATTTPHEVYHGADALIELHEAALSELTRLRAVEATAREYVTAEAAWRETKKQIGGTPGYGWMTEGQAAVSKWRDRALAALRAVLDGQGRG